MIQQMLCYRGCLICLKNGVDTINMYCVEEKTILRGFIVFILTFVRFWLLSGKMCVIHLNKWRTIWIETAWSSIVQRITGYSNIWKVIAIGWNIKIDFDYFFFYFFHKFFRIHTGTITQCSNKQFQSSFG